MSSVTDEIPLSLSDDDLFVAYRFPGDKSYYLMIDEDDSSCSNEFQIKPFNKHKSLGVTIRSATPKKELPFQFFTKASCLRSSTPKDDYYDAADNMIHKMNQTALQKVVLSRIKIIPNHGLDFYQLFLNLSNTYPNAFVFFYNIPGEGAWMGATPEVLLEQIDDTSSTVALAATQKVNGRSTDDVVWNEKEIEEQAIIQRFIESNLQSINIPFHKSQTKTVRAGNVFHLKTTYQFNTQNNPDEVLEKLHPGPAICGTPTKDALKEIEASEAHERDYYCGYLGFKSKHKTSYFINLRSMQIFEDSLALFVGGGLTADSNTASEWEETEIKSKTLESVIQKSYIYAHNVE